MTGSPLPFLISSVLLCCVAAPTPCQCRLFASHWGGANTDFVIEVFPDVSTGGYYGAGWTDSYGRAGDFLLVRFDSTGVPIGNTAWGGALDEAWGGADLHVTSGQIYAAGGSTSFGASSDIAVVKYDNAGVVQWGLTWSSNSGYDEFADAVSVDGAGNVFVAGGIARNGNSSRDVLVLELPPTVGGTLPSVLASATWGGTTDDDSINASAIDAISPTPGLVVVGNTTIRSNLDMDLLLQKYDSNLNLLWTRTWGGGNRKDDGEGVVVDAVGDIYAIGATQTAPGGSEHALITKWTHDGTLVWSRVFGGASDDSVGGARIDASGNLLASGSTSSFGAGPPDGLLLRVDPNGNLLAAYTWGTSGNDGLGRTWALAGGEFVMPALGAANSALVPIPGIAPLVPSGTSQTHGPSAGPAPAATVVQQTGASPGPPGSPAGVDVWLYRYEGASATVDPTGGCPPVLHPCGGPVLGFGGLPIIGKTFDILRTSTCAPQLSVLVIGSMQPPMSLPSGAVLCVAPMLFRIYLGATSSSLSVAVPNQSVFCGTALYVQWGDLSTTPQLHLGSSAVGSFTVGL